MIKDKKEKTMTFRLSLEDYDWLVKASYSMGSTPSKFVRQLIQMSINATKAAELKINKLEEEIKEVTN